MTKILILGGTREASELAHTLTEAGNEVTTSLAGRTREPKPLAGKVRIGGFGGAEGLADFLVQNHFDKLVDATHPFAKQISANAKLAAEKSGIIFEKRTRAPWKKVDGDNWIEVTGLEEACKVSPPGSRILLALGSQHISGFETRHDVFYLVRMVDKPPTPLKLPNHELVIGKPSLDWSDEVQLLRDNKITHVICRNSGGEGAYAKVRAARELSLPVIMIQHPGG